MYACVMEYSETTPFENLRNSCILKMYPRWMLTFSWKHSRLVPIFLSCTSYAKQLTLNINNLPGLRENIQYAHATGATRKPSWSKPPQLHHRNEFSVANTLWTAAMVESASTQMVRHKQILGDISTSDKNTFVSLNTQRSFVGCFWAWLATQNLLPPLDTAQSIALVSVRRWMGHPCCAYCSCYWVVRRLLAQWAARKIPQSLNEWCHRSLKLFAADNTSFWFPLRFGSFVQYCTIQKNGEGLRM